LIEGERYLRRDGQITGPLKFRSDGEDYPFFDPITTYSYTKTGSFFDEYPDAADLVALVDSGVSGGVIKGMREYNDIDEKTGQVTSVALKYDGDKVPYDLLPLDLLDGASRVFRHGMKKYARNNYRNGFEPVRLLGALLRHTASLQQAIEQEDLDGSKGFLLDEESGLSHIHHVLCSTMMLVDSMRKKGFKI